MLIAMLLCFGLLGCMSANTSDITGTWFVANKSRLRFLPAEQQKATAQITLEPNGIFVASEIPEDLPYGPPEAGVGLVTGQGVWRLLSREGKQQIQLTSEQISVGQRGMVPFGAQLTISRGWSAVSLFYFQGDADQGRKIEFEKK